MYDDVSMSTAIAELQYISLIDPAALHGIRALTRVHTSPGQGLPCVRCGGGLPSSRVRHSLRAADAGIAADAVVSFIAGASTH